jgi:hypothetical protein
MRLQCCEFPFTLSPVDWVFDAWILLRTVGTTLSFVIHVSSQTPRVLKIAQEWVHVDLFANDLSFVLSSRTIQGHPGQF